MQVGRDEDEPQQPDADDSGQEGEEPGERLTHVSTLGGCVSGDNRRYRSS